jgi:hypothetical protein
MESISCTVSETTNPATPPCLSFNHLRAPVSSSASCRCFAIFNLAGLMMDGDISVDNGPSPTCPKFTARIQALRLVIQDGSRACFRGSFRGIFRTEILLRCFFLPFFQSSEEICLVSSSVCRALPFSMHLEQETDRLDKRRSACRNMSLDS